MQIAFSKSEVSENGSTSGLSLAPLPSTFHNKGSRRADNSGHGACEGLLSSACILNYRARLWGSPASPQSPAAGARPRASSTAAAPGARSDLGGRGAAAPGSGEMDGASGASGEEANASLLFDGNLSTPVVCPQVCFARPLGPGPPALRPSSFRSPWNQLRRLPGGAKPVRGCLNAARRAARRERRGARRRTCWWRLGPCRRRAPPCGPRRRPPPVSGAAAAAAERRAWRVRCQLCRWGGWGAVDSGGRGGEAACWYDARRGRRSPPSACRRA